MDDLQPRRIRGEQALQCAGGFGGGCEPAFEPGEVVADQGGAFVDVGGEEAGDVADRHVEVAESPDDLGGRYLVGGVVAVFARVGGQAQRQVGLDGVRTPSWSW